MHLTASSLSTSKVLRPKGWIYVAALFALPITLITGALIQYYLKTVGTEILQSWLQTEAVSIQEGNLLSSVSSNRRMLLSSRLITTIQLLDVASPTSPVIIMEFGEPMDSPTATRGLGPGETRSISVWPLHERIQYRFVEKQNLVLVVDLNPPIAKWAFSAVLLVFLSVVLCSLLLLNRLIRLEERKRLQIVQETLNELATRSSPSEWIENTSPSVASSWSTLKVTIDTIRQNVEDQSRRAAIAQMVQMMAHDVRKPFSILRLGMKHLEEAMDLAGMKRILARLVPEVDKAVSAVNGLIADVMEVGSTGTSIVPESTTATVLVEVALNEAFRIFPSADVEISYDFNNSNMVGIDRLKVGRVFSNIICNAIQAMNQKGTLWVKTWQQHGFVEFCIGNNGSSIPPEDVPKLFDAFFTKGKKGGTGLGLAVAKKMVAAHGGRIWCISEADGEHLGGHVEFHFTLPIAHEVAIEHATSLPLRSPKAANSLCVFEEVQTAEVGTLPTPENCSHIFGRPRPEVAVVEDNAFILDAWETLLDKDATVHSFHGPGELIARLEREPGFLKRLSILVTDFYFSGSNENGFSVGKYVKKRQPNLPVLLSTDADLVYDLENGTIDQLIGKEPMGLADLLRITQRFRELNPIVHSRVLDK